MLKIYSIITLSLILSHSAYAEDDANSAQSNSGVEKKLEVLKPVIPIAPAVPIPSPMPNSEPKLSPESAPTTAKPAQSPAPIVTESASPASANTTKAPTLVAPGSEPPPQKTLKSLKDLKNPSVNNQSPATTVEPTSSTPQNPVSDSATPVLKPTISEPQLKVLGPVDPIPAKQDAPVQPLHATPTPEKNKVTPEVPKGMPVITTTQPQSEVIKPNLDPSVPKALPDVEKQAPQVNLPASTPNAPKVELPAENKTEKTLPEATTATDPKLPPSSTPAQSGQAQTTPTVQNSDASQAPAAPDKILTLPGQTGELKTLKSEAAKTDKVQEVVVPFPEVEGSLMFNQIDLSKVEIVYRAYRERLKNSAQPSSAEAAKNDVVGEILGRLKTTNQTVQLRNLPNSVFLNSIMYHSEKDKVAWIDGKKYQVGDILDPIKLIDLTATSAKIEFNTTNYKFDTVQSATLLTDEKQKELVQIDSVAKTITFTIKPNQRIDLVSFKVKEGKGRGAVASMVPPGGNRPNPNQPQGQGLGNIIPRPVSGPYTGGIPTSPSQFLNDPAINPAAAITPAPTAAPASAPAPAPATVTPELPSGVDPITLRPQPPVDPQKNSALTPSIDSSITSNLKAVLEAGAQLQNNSQPTEKNTNKLNIQIENQIQRIDNGVSKVEQKYDTLQDLKKTMQNN